VEKDEIQVASPVVVSVANASGGKGSKRRRCAAFCNIHQVVGLVISACCRLSILTTCQFCQCRKKAKAAAAAEGGSGTSARVSSRSTSRDEEFFLGADDSDTHGFSEESLRVRGNSDSNDNRTAIEEAVLTLTSDEAGDLVRNNRSMMRWDSRKMKYVEANSLNDRSKTKNEAGVMVSKKDEKAGKDTIYQSWVQKTNQRIPKAGTMESETAERSFPILHMHARARTHILTALLVQTVDECPVSPASVLVL
jgi:hypothetical protein